MELSEMECTAEEEEEIMKAIAIESQSQKQWGLLRTHVERMIEQVDGTDSLLRIRKGGLPSIAESTWCQVLHKIMEIDGTCPKIKTPMR